VKISPYCDCGKGLPHMRNLRSYVGRAQTGQPDFVLRAAGVLRTVRMLELVPSFTGRRRLVRSSFGVQRAHVTKHLENSIHPHSPNDVLEHVLIGPTAIHADGHLYSPSRGFHDDASRKRDARAHTSARRIFIARCSS